MYKLWPGLLLLSLASGCASLQSFRVVDAQTGQPLEEIKAERLKGNVHFSAIPLVMLDDLAPVERRATDASGAIKFEQAGSQFAFNPSSSHAGYGAAFVTATSSGIVIRYPEERPCRTISVMPINGVVDVPLRRRQSPSKPDW
jgi:hypothetical protein